MIIVTGFPKLDGYKVHKHVYVNGVFNPFSSFFMFPLVTTIYKKMEMKLVPFYKWKHIFT